MHVPVLLNEVIKTFSPKPNENYIDCTIGAGGHSFKILEKISPKGKVLGIDLSLKAIKKLEKIKKEKKLSNRLILVNDNFSHLKHIIAKKDFKPVHGILFDFGISTDLLKNSNRGFTFIKKEPLDMRFNTKKSNLTAKKIVNNYSQKELENIFVKYGEERWSKKISQEIIKQRKRSPLKTTRDLRRAIEKALGYKFHIKCLARIFQALRIKVNNELENIEKGLRQSFNVLEKGGKIITITFHSLEDKIVKSYFKDNNKLISLFKTPLKPSDQEIKKNNKARSAKLRAVYKK